MSQSGFVDVRIVSKKFAEWLEPFLDEIAEANDGWCDVNVSIDGEIVDIDSSGCDAMFSGVPKQLSVYDFRFFYTKHCHFPPHFPFTKVSNANSQRVSSLFFFINK